MLIGALCIILAAGVVNIAVAQSDKPKIALYIVNDELSDAEKRVLIAKFLKPFTESGQFGVIDRSDVFTQQATKERIKQRDGSVNDGEIYRIGYESGAKYVLMVDLVKAFGTRHNVSARLVDVETAEIFGAQGETDIKNLDDISDAADEVFYQITGIGTGSKNRAIKLQIEERRKSTHWLSVGAGTGLIPDDKASMYSGAIAGIAGGYLSGKYGGTYGETAFTWGVGLTIGAGIGSGDAVRVCGGVNVYPINDFFVQCSYGTAAYSYKTSAQYVSGSYTSAKTIIENGYGLMAGYDYHIRQLKIGSGHIMISLAGGMTNVESEGWIPAYSALIGYAFNY
jgi:TolB-like protein